ncbi:hypothetical protein FKP32DRAFT_1671249 [Trametes sanguinea]|nr:hypothetical protein FKP32DRAFT_1671249 [Trametes sanguinea]
MGPVEKARQQERANLAVSPSREAHKQELRRARNRRYQAKLKSLRAQSQSEDRVERHFRFGCPSGVVGGAGIVGDSSAQTSQSTCSISVPFTFDAELLDTIDLLNRRLKKWECPDDPRGFVQKLNKQISDLQEQDSLTTAWVRELEDWVLEGDTLLDGFQTLISGGSLSSLECEDAGQLWSEISRVTFKMQYVLATVEVRLDALSVKAK